MNLNTFKSWNTVFFVLGVGVVLGYAVGFVMGVFLL